MSDTELRAIERRLVRDGQLVNFVLAAIEGIKDPTVLATICDAASAKIPIGSPVCVLGTGYPSAPAGPIMVQPGGRVRTAIYVPANEGHPDFVCYRILTQTEGDVALSLSSWATDSILVNALSLLGISSIPMHGTRFPSASRVEVELVSRENEPAWALISLVGRFMPQKQMQMLSTQALLDKHHETLGQLVALRAQAGGE